MNATTARTGLLVAALVALAVAAGKVRPPGAVGQPYAKGDA